MTTQTKTETKTIQVEAINPLTGETSNMKLVIPTSIPTADRADYLRALFDAYGRQLDGHWKGRIEATVHVDLATDMADAMDFMGAIVDRKRTLTSGMVRISSRGYWAHGF